MLIFRLLVAVNAGFYIYKMKTWFFFFMNLLYNFVIFIWFYCNIKLFYVKIYSLSKISCLTVFIDFRKWICLRLQIWTQWNGVLWWEEWDFGLYVWCRDLEISRSIFSRGGALKCLSCFTLFPLPRQRGSRISTTYVTGKAEFINIWRWNFGFIVCWERPVVRKQLFIALFGACSGLKTLLWFL